VILRHFKPNPTVLKQHLQMLNSYKKLKMGPNWFSSSTTSWPCALDGWDKRELTPNLRVKRILMRTSTQYKETSKYIIIHVYKLCI